MDDIIEKLSLLDYENSFCKGWKKKRISRIYFAHEPHMGEDTNQRINYLYDMCYWLMNMNKEKVSAFRFTHNYNYSLSQIYLFGGRGHFHFLSICLFNCFCNSNLGGKSSKVIKLASEWCECALVDIGGRLLFDCAMYVCI